MRLNWVGVALHRRRPQPAAQPPDAAAERAPSYPPANLGDVASLSARGVHRQFVGMEDQQVDTCTRAWNKVVEPDGTPPQQIAADLVKVAVDRKALFNSCGGFVYGTVDRSYCNCYRGDHGLLTIDRGPGYEPVAGKMKLTFVVKETTASPGDWEAVVDAPDRP